MWLFLTAIYKFSSLFNNVDQLKGWPVLDFSLVASFSRMLDKISGLFRLFTFMLRNWSLTTSLFTFCSFFYCIMSLIKLEFLKDYNKIYISDTRINIKSLVQKINLNIVNQKRKENRCGWWRGDGGKIKEFEINLKIGHIEGLTCCK